MTYNLMARHNKFNFHSNKFYIGVMALMNTDQI